MANSKVNVVMCGTGEYTTGFVGGGGSKSDKKMGVVALVMIDLRRRGKVDKIGLVGTNGTKFTAIREHLNSKIGKGFKDMDTTMATFPADNVTSKPDAYKDAIDTLSPGDAITIFTPDDTHYEIALYAVRKGVHVFLTKPPVKTVKDHLSLVAEAQKHNVLVAIDYHKRWDPIYIDARAKMRGLGQFGYFYSYMTQPKFQLETFKGWAGKSSDISYYLNSHHVDIHVWGMEGIARPLHVSASGATGIAHSPAYGCPAGTEDTITLLVTWQNIAAPDALGTAVYTASWAAAAKSEVHSQQRFTYMGHKGEVRVDQAHRGYEYTPDETGYACVNPLYMSYMPDANGYFQGQLGYGYRSFELFIDAVAKIKTGQAQPLDFDNSLATLRTTTLTTAILEAGRISLDKKGGLVHFQYDKDGHFVGLN